MMTMDERLSIYLKAKELFTQHIENKAVNTSLLGIPTYTDGSPFLCDNMKFAVHALFGEIKFEIRDLPEFMAFKPRDVDEYALWWARWDHQSRMACLNKCIEQVHP